MPTTVRIQNTVRDYDTWRASFEKYEAFRAELRVLSHRISRGITVPEEIVIDLQFSDESDAQAFLPKLARVMDTPQARRNLVHHQPPRLYTLVEEHIVTPPSGNLRVTPQQQE